jgi:glycosyltransferase-like protein
MSPLRIAMLTYSVKPRGGVVHSMAVAGALAERGHSVELFAVGRPGEGFFRPTPVRHTIIRHVPPDVPFDERIAALIRTYTNGLRERLSRSRFDVIHAQDCISANAALTLRDERVVNHVIRTVHHVDEFVSPSLIACQNRSILQPDHVVCVSEPWVERVHDEFGVDAGLVCNGVDTERYRPPRDAAERDAARARHAFGDRLVVLAVGGVEPRKGSLTLLDAFARLRTQLTDRDPLLVIAGGATLFDYRDEVERFAERRAALRLDDDAVRVLGPVDDGALEDLYRAADVFCFPSVKEGFGLVVLEALASGLPVVASDIDVLQGVVVHERSALLAPCGDGAAFAHELARAATDGDLVARLRAGGRAVVARHGWDAAAEAHELAYDEFLDTRLAAAAAG